MHVTFLNDHVIFEGTDPEKTIQTDRHPVGEKLFHNRLCTAQQKFGLSIARVIHQTL